ncbi:LPXTG cell wall anchor domain-containing protein [Psychrobacillus sp. L4]|uniref:LPXTG cell wall anchor domain-containing protein n=1 Tax=Psychrobacillus sp. L4 TaxID=3236892 RepID=UPI0036F2469A
MKTISKNFTCTVLGFLTMLFLTPSFVAAEGNGSHLPLQIEVNLLDNNPDKADIMDVEVNNLIGIDSINIKISNEGKMKEALVTASVIDEEIGDTEVSILSQSETKTESEKALVDIVTENPLIIDEVDVDIMNQQETLRETDKTSKEAVVNIGLENLAIVKDVEIGVLKQEQVEEGTTSSREDQGVHSKITDLPVLGTLHVGLLESEKKEANEEYVDNSKLVTIGLENASSSKNAILDGLELNVLENNNMENDSFEKHKSSVVNAELADQVLGNIDINVLLSESIKEGDFKKYDSGVVELVSNELPVLNEVHLSILDRHSQSSGEVKSFSEGVLQLEVFSDVIGSLNADVLTSKGYTDNGGTTQRDNTISLGLNNLLGSVGIDILPRETYLAAQPIINPNNPNNDPDESTDETSEEINAEVPVVVDDNEEGNQGTNDDMTESPNDGTTGMIDETTNEVDFDVGAMDEDESSLVGFIANSNVVSGSKSLRNSGIFTESSLPKTGGFLNSMMLLLMAVCLLGGGVTIRKFA